ncbi:MAG: hypothetical protein JO015_05995 [Verrucomicrobia bacterium]|nr:hypothetical protein [Verrucomicrobiota bacterium]
MTVFPRLSDGGLPRRWVLFLAGSIGLGCAVAATRAAEGAGPLRQPSIEESAAASVVARVVAAFIAAGESNDASARAAYLAPQVFFYGRKRTRAQASREINLVYRLWPQRKFTPAENIDVYAIPHHPGVYKATAMLEYDMLNRQNERTAGRSRMTCILERDRAGVRIVGVDEKLLP